MFIIIVLIIDNKYQQAIYILNTLIDLSSNIFAQIEGGNAYIQNGTDFMYRFLCFGALFSTELLRPSIHYSIYPDEHF
jgi:hypothetical protein